MNFHEQLKEAREKRGLSQWDAAELIGINISTYTNYENHRYERHTKTKTQIIKSGFLEQGEVISQEETKKTKRKSGNRIPNIPNFYERLNSVCNEDGKIMVDKNHPVLQNLRYDLGVATKIDTPKEFAKRLRKAREEKGLTQQEAADIVGIGKGSYVPYEYAIVKGRGKTYHAIINSDLFR